MSETDTERGHMRRLPLAAWPVSAKICRHCVCRRPIIGAPIRFKPVSAIGDRPRGSPLAIAVSDGFTAPMLTKKLVSTT